MRSVPSGSTAYWTPASGAVGTGDAGRKSLLDDITSTLREAGTPAAFVRRLDGQFQEAFRRSKAALAGIPAATPATPSGVASERADEDQLQALLAELSHSVAGSPARASVGTSQSPLDQRRLGSPASSRSFAHLFSPSPSFRGAATGSQTELSSLAGLVPGLAAVQRAESRREQPSPAEQSQRPAAPAAWGKRAARSPAPAAAASQTSSPVSPGALAWKAAAKAWRERSGGPSSAERKSAPRQRTRLEELLADIERQRAASSARTSLQAGSAGQQAPAAPSLSPPDVLPEAASPVWEAAAVQLPERPPTIVSIAAQVPEQGAAALPAEPTLPVEKRFPAAAEALLARIESWGAAEAAVHADQAELVRQRMAPFAGGA